MKASIELYGGTEHPWPSVERTRRFYLHALREHALSDARPGQPGKADAYLQFAGGECFSFRPHPDASLVIAMHGGPIVSHEGIREGLSNLETSDVLLTNCTSDARILEEMWGGAPEDGPLVRQINLPANASMFQPDDKAECKEMMPLPECDLVVGFVGRLLPQKNLHHFLRMFQKVREAMLPRKVAALVIGNYWIDYPVLPFVTKDYPDYIGHVLESCHLHEHVVYMPANLSNDDLVAAYNAMDVLVHPTSSLDENFGYVPIEAMACGVPVVGAAYGGLKDTIVDGRTGFLMDTWTTDGGLRMDTGAGVARTLELLRDDQVRASFGEAAHRHVRTVYSVETCSAALERAVLDGIAARQSRRGRAVRPHGAPPVRPPSGILPEAPGHTWEHYAPVVAHYASRGVPTSLDVCSLHIYAPLKFEGETAISDDAAWPARYRLDMVERAVVDAVMRGTPMHDIVADGASRAAVDTLLARGLLTGRIRGGAR